MSSSHVQQVRPLRLLLTLALAIATLAPLAGVGTALAQATTSAITLRAFGIDPQQLSAAPTTLSDFQYIINQDNVGSVTQARNGGCNQADPSYPANCNWPSIRAQTGYAPIVTQGDASDFAPGGQFAGGLTLPNGNYLVSIIADGYKIDGAWFSIPAPAASGGPAVVSATLNVAPLPAATLRAIIFNDNAPTNGAPDVPAEPGLPGFRVTVSDTLGEISNDVYGNPICSNYERDTDGNVRFDGNGAPIINASNPIISTGCLYTGPDGEVAIPNLGPNRYTMLATAPDGQYWIQTATLEGNHDWDVWVQEGSTGYDTEFAVAGEPFPWVPFGFVQPSAAPAAGVQPGATGGIKGNVMAVTVYTPGVGGLPYSGSIWAGLSGAKLDKPIAQPWLSLNDLQGGDRAVWVGQGDAQGNFLIPNVPDGDYQLTWWDQDQLYLLDWQQVSVKNGQITDLGRLDLTAWYAHLRGRICTDLNYDGRCQSGEPGVPGFPLAVKRRTNSVMDRGNQGAVTDSQGNYELDSVYPLSQWVVIEAYSDSFYTTGVTYQADNDPTEHAIAGAGVDVNFLSIIGQNGRLDWAVQRYNALPIPRRDPNGNLIPRNGGIVGTVSYDTTRNELDPRYAAVENWQPGIPNLTVNLHRPVLCALTDTLPSGESCVRSPNGAGYYVATAEGALKLGTLLNSATTESWARPTGCVARSADGSPLSPSFYQALPSGSSSDQECVEAPMSGIQFGSEYAAVDGNYGFTDGCLTVAFEACSAGDFAPLPAGDYLVDVVIPNDDYGRPQYQVTREEDINVFSGDSYVPQVPPPTCAGALHTVDVAGLGADGPDAVVNPTFLGEGGSPYEGQQRPLCTTKLVSLGSGRSIAPSFNLFTAVPLPGRWFGYIVDDLNLSTNPQDLLFGEKAGVPNSPIGIYDYANRLVRTISSDPNGVFEVLLPSTTTINCPTPTGVCANLYRIVGNDPGVPGRLNPNYNPQLRTISATFEIFPGDIEPADLAPTQIGVSIQAPGSQINGAVSCRLAVDTPQIFAVNQPYVRGTSRTLTISGQGFGGTPGALTLGGTALAPSSWNNYQITATVPANFAPGPQQLLIRSAGGQTTQNGLSIHVIGDDYTPRLFEVGPGRQYASIQAALDAAPQNGNGLVVVYPGGVPDSANPAYNPQLAYFENLIVSKAVRLQGVGPGGVYTDAAGNALSVNGQTTVDGSIIDGAAYGGDTVLANTWRTRMAALLAQGWLGNQTIYEGAVITALAPRTSTYNVVRPLLIDGFTIQGGNQQGFPGNIGEIFGLPNGVAPTVETQGGGIYANAYVDYLTVSNNVLQSNGGAYAGAIRIGTPNLPGQANDGQNDRLAILHNRLIANGGTNLAGAVGLFAGTQSYEIGYNDFCGNFSAEYGGAISHYGFSGGNGPTSTIHDNRIYFNRSYDEGGAIMVAGALPADPSTLSTGAGPVDIYNNLIQANLANDDGGGVRFLQAGNFAFNLYNNIIANNISTHEGGGVAVDDTPNLRLFNNTVMKNLTTATALTSNGQPAPAGLSTTLNSDQLQATLAGGIGGCGQTGNAPCFSKPLLFNNIFWDNRAGSWNDTTNTLSGIGTAGLGDINLWDMGLAGNPASLLEPTNSILNSALGTAASPTNKVSIDPAVIDGSYDVSVLTLPWRALPGLMGTTLLAVDLPPNLLGNYHLGGSSSPAVNAGRSEVTVPPYQRPTASLSAPSFDIDNQGRPAGGGYDIGADEVQAVADLGITVDDGVATAGPGQVLTYRIVVTNAGPDAVSLARVSDTPPAVLSNVSWTCTATPGSSCRVPSASGRINRTVNLAQGGSVTYLLSGTVSATPTASSIVNTATVTAPSGTNDPNPGNNSASDTNSIPTADLAITNSDGATSVSQGASVSYTLIVTNNGPDAVSGATVSDSVTTLTGASWTCATCAPASGSGNSFTTAVSLPAGGSATLRVNGTVPTGLNGGVIVNSASVAPPSGVFDPALGNNSASDSDLIAVPLPTLALIDNFNRTNANTLGGSWSQLVLFGQAAIRVNSQQASAALLGAAYWNGAGSSYSNRQGAAFSFANGQGSGTSLVLKATGGASRPTSYIRVQYQGGQVTIATTTNGAGFTNRGSFAASFAQGDVLSATAYGDGTVNVYKGATLVASASIPTSGAGSWAPGASGGRIGIQLPTGARVDDFRGGDLP